MVESRLGIASSRRLQPARICIVACCDLHPPLGPLAVRDVALDAMKLATSSDPSRMGWTSMATQYFRPDLP